jgi:hypothetical protein
MVPNLPARSTSCSFLLQSRGHWSKITTTRPWSIYQVGILTTTLTCCTVSDQSKIQMIFRIYALTRRAPCQHAVRRTCLQDGLTLNSKRLSNWKVHKTQFKTESSDTTPLGTLLKRCNTRHWLFHFLGLRINWIVPESFKISMTIGLSRH